MNSLVGCRMEVGHEWPHVVSKDANPRHPRADLVQVNAELVLELIALKDSPVEQLAREPVD